MAWLLRSPAGTAARATSRSRSAGDACGATGQAGQGRQHVADRDGPRSRLIATAAPLGHGPYQRAKAPGGAAHRDKPPAIGRDSEEKSEPRRARSS